jgi:hypothetical protein
MSIVIKKMLLREAFEKKMKLIRHENKKVIVGE